MINSKENRKSPAVVLVPMLLLSLFIQLVRLPSVVSENRPDLLILVILFFSMNSKFTYKLEVSWLVGIVLDLASGAPLGVNAFVICTQIYIISTQFKNFAKYEIYQQCIIIGLVNLIVTVLGYWIEHIIGQSYYEITFFIPSIVTALFWPIIFLTCSLLCATFSVSTDKDNESKIN